MVAEAAAGAPLCVGLDDVARVVEAEGKDAAVSRFGAKATQCAQIGAVLPQVRGALRGASEGRVVKRGTTARSAGLAPVAVREGPPETLPLLRS